MFLTLLDKHRYCLQLGHTGAGLVDGHSWLRAREVAYQYKLVPNEMGEVNCVMLSVLRE